MELSEITIYIPRRSNSSFVNETPLLDRSFIPIPPLLHLVYSATDMLPKEDPQSPALSSPSPFRFRFNWTETSSFGSAKTYASMGSSWRRELHSNLKNGLLLPSNLCPALCSVRPFPLLSKMSFTLSGE